MKRKCQYSYPDRSLSAITPHVTNHRAGITLIEVAVSTILVGSIMIASLRAVGSVAQYRGVTNDQQQGILLANELLTRICLLDYNDPDQTPELGREQWEDELNLAYDDIDDYDGFSESPPTDGEGNVLTGFQNWSWSVVVKYVHPANLALLSQDAGAKLIWISVAKNGQNVTELHFVKTDISGQEPEL